MGGCTPPPRTDGRTHGTEFIYEVHTHAQHTKGWRRVNITQTFKNYGIFGERNCYAWTNFNGNTRVGGGTGFLIINSNMFRMFFFRDFFGKGV